MQEQIASVCESSSRLTEQEYSKLRWRCRRGLLENDLFITRYLEQYGSQMTVIQAQAMYALMDLPDNDLLDLFLARKEPSGALDRADVCELLSAIRRSC